MRSTAPPQIFVRSRLLLTTVWLVLAVAAVLWYRPLFWREQPDRALTRFDDAQRLAAAGQPAEALTAVNDALVTRPREAGYLVFKGHRELELNRPADAESSFRQALGLQPTNIEARLGLGHALATAGKREEALSILSSAAAGDLTAAHLRRRSQLYSMLSAYALALEDVTELLTATPNDRQLLDEASTLALATQNWGAAATLSERLAAAVDDPAVKRRAVDRRATALRNLGRTDEAYAAYRLAPAPDNLQARAELALQLGDFAAASELYRALATREPADVEVRRRLAYALDRAGRRREAAALYQRLVDQGGADLVTRQRYAWLLNSEGRYNEAWQIVAGLSGGAPSTGSGQARSAELLGLQARTAAWAGRAQESVPLLRAMLSIEPQDAELWKLLAESYRVLGDESSRAEALRSYVRLRSQDGKAREDLAKLLARIGPIDEAIEEYRRLAAEHPDDVELLRSFGILLETKGQLREAIPLYVRAVEKNGDPALLLRLARLNRWTDRPADAVTWYQRYIAAVTDQVLRRPARGELALALFESGDAAGGLHQIQQLAREARLEPDNLLTGARAATALGQPGVAAEYLQLLSEERSLDRAERVWLAGQHRSAGQSDRALALYEQLVRDSPPDAIVLEAAGDLRADRRDYRSALEHYRLIPTPPAAVLLKIARTAAADSTLEGASRAYTEYLNANPTDLDVRLEAARYFAGAHQPQAAIQAYREVVAARGAAGLRIEMARVALEAKDFHDAERWAREAVSAGENPTAAASVLGESLHLQGRSAEALQVLRPLAGTSPSPDALIWLGHAAVATDRQLEGFRSFDRALAGGATPTGSLWLWRGLAAQNRGDYYRAAASYERALAEGADALELQTAQLALRTATSPRLEVPLTFRGDANDLGFVESGATAAAFLRGNRARIGVDILRGELSQDDFRASRTAGLLSMDHLFPAPQLEVQAAFGQERYETARRLTTARASGRYAFSDTTVASLTIARESLLSPGERDDPYDFNRIINLAALGPGFRVHRISGFLESRIAERSRLHENAGVEWYQDGNRRMSAYLHYEVPVHGGTRQWVVFRPNASFEHFPFTSPFYFSPPKHLTLGAMLRGIFTFPRVRFEADLNPLMSTTFDALGFGAYGMTTVTVRVRRVSIEGHTFVFYDDLERYRRWRAGVRLIVPLGR